MHKIVQIHLLRAFVAYLKIDTIYVLYPESFCDKNLVIRKVFATKILLSGKFSLFLTLAEVSNILTMCRIGNVLCDSTQWGNILAGGGNKKARVLQPIDQRNHDPTLLITKDLSAKIALLSGSVWQPSTLGQGDLLLKLTKCTKAVVIVSTLLCANK